MGKSLSLLFSFLICLLTVIPPLNVKAETTTVYVDPASRTVLQVGETFSVNVTVADVDLLYAWEFQLCYNSGILNASSWTPGPVFALPDVMIFNQTWTDNYNATHGLVHIVCTIITQRTFTGTTTLATVQFKVRSVETTVLHLQNTLLLDDSSPFPQEIPHITTDGTIYARTTSRDVAVTNITPEKTVVGQGYLTRINVTVANNGNFSGTFTVTIQSNTTAAGTQTVPDLSNGASASLTLVWNTSGFAKGNYTIRAYIQPVSSETDSSDNNYTCTIPVHVGVPGDVSSAVPGVYDGTVNMRDISYMIILFNTKPTSPNWKPNADVNDDGVVNMRDITIAIINFNKHE